MTNTSNKNSDTQTELKQNKVSNITERTLLVDEGQAIERVKKWGHMVSPIMAYDRWHHLIPSTFHYWEQRKEYKKLLKHGGAFNPHEEIQAQFELMVRRVREAKFKEEQEKRQEELRKKEEQRKINREQTDQITDVVEAAGKGLGLQIKNIHYSNNDYNMHIEIVSDDIRKKIQNSVLEKDDIVYCGLDLYNGIETSTALGGSMYPYRISCLNGQVVRGKEFGTFSIPGVLDAEKRLVQMELGIGQVFDTFDIFVQRCELFAATKTNLKQANGFYLKTHGIIADEHMPKSYVIDPEFPKKLKRFTEANKHMDLGEILNLGLKDQRSAPLPVISVGDRSTAWEDLNDITGSINEKHRAKYEKSGLPKLNFSSLGNLTNAAHKALFQVIQ